MTNFATTKLRQSVAATNSVANKMWQDLAKNWAYDMRAMLLEKYGEPQVWQWTKHMPKMLWHD